MIKLPAELNQKGSPRKAFGRQRRTSLFRAGEAGVVPLPLLIAIVAVIGFLAFAFYAPFKDQLLTSLYPKPTSEASQAVKFAPDTVLVKFKDNISKEDKDKTISESGAKEEKEIDKIKVKVLKVVSGKVEETVSRLKNNPNVEFAEPDFIVEGDAVPNDPSYSSQWGMKKIQADGAWNVTQGANTVKVAVLDTGVDSTHPDLGAKVVAKIGYSGSAAEPLSNCGHGTHVAGTVGAITNNSLGVAGVGYDTTIMNGKVLAYSDCTGTMSDVASGMIWAADNGAKVINMSLGSTNYSSTGDNAVNYAWNKGVVLVAAAMNNGSTSYGYPAAYTNVIAVANTDVNDNKSSTSNYGTWVDIAAPGSYILSTCMGGGYCNYSGTSMASPHVAGVAALLFALHPDWTAAQIRTQIESTADPITGTGTLWMNGRLNACKAVGCTPTSTPAPTPTPSPTPTPTPIPVESTPPTVSVTSPLNGAIIKRNTNFTILAEANDNVAVSKVEFYVDGGLKCTDTSSAYVCSTKIGGKPKASHTIQVRAYDTSGNTASASINVTVQ